MFQWSWTQTAQLATPCRLSLTLTLLPHVNGPSMSRSILVKTGTVVDHQDVFSTFMIQLCQAKGTFPTTVMIGVPHQFLPQVSNISNSSICYFNNLNLNVGIEFHILLYSDPFEQPAIQHLHSASSRLSRCLLLSSYHRLIWSFVRFSCLNFWIYLIFTWFKTYF